MSQLEALDSHLLEVISFDSIPSFLEKNCVVTVTVQEVFKNLRQNFQTFQKDQHPAKTSVKFFFLREQDGAGQRQPRFLFLTVTDQDLIALSSIFGDTLEKALEIINDNKVTYYHTSSNVAGIFQVEGSSSESYTIFPSVNYCPCRSYKYQVAGGSQILCKHVLATVIADVTGKKQAIEVSGDHLKDLLLMIVNFRMNDKEDWHNQNPYLGQFMNPLSGVPPTFNIPSNAWIPVPPQTMPSNNWVHVPPQTMPWGTPPESQPQVVRFTAGESSSRPHSFKRRCDSSMEAPPSKMLVTEEKMAAHMRSLHISDVETPPVASNINCKEESMETDRLPRLVLSDEIKNLKTDSLIPEPLLKKLEKPEMALVLWQPPATDLSSKLKELKKLSKIKPKKEDEENKKENNVDEVMETETCDNNVDNVFRPIDPVPMPTMRNQYLQPIPQFQGYSPFS